MPTIDSHYPTISSNQHIIMFMETPLLKKCCN